MRREIATNVIIVIKWVVLIGAITCEPRGTADSRDLVRNAIEQISKSPNYGWIMRFDTGCTGVPRPGEIHGKCEKGGFTAVTVTVMGEVDPILWTTKRRN